MAYVLAWNIKKEYNKSLAQGQTKYSFYFIQNSQLADYKEDCDNYLVA